MLQKIGSGPIFDQLRVSVDLWDIGIRYCRCRRRRRRRRSILLELSNCVALSPGITTKDSVGNATASRVDPHIVNVSLGIFPVAIVEEPGVGYLDWSGRRCGDKCCCRGGGSCGVAAAADAVRQRGQCVLGKQPKEQHIDEDGRQRSILQPSCDGLHLAHDGFANDVEAQHDLSHHGEDDITLSRWAIARHIIR